MEKGEKEREREEFINDHFLLPEMWEDTRNSLLPRGKKNYSFSSRPAR
jgi:hypothetical protein